MECYSFRMLSYNHRKAYKRLSVRRSASKFLKKTALLCGGAVFVLEKREVVSRGRYGKFEIHQKRGRSAGKRPCRRHRLRQGKTAQTSDAGSRRPFLSLPVTDRRKLKKLKAKEPDEDDIDQQMAMIAGLVEAAQNGDAACANVIVKLLGEALPVADGADRLEKAAKILGGVESVIE